MGFGKNLLAWALTNYELDNYNTTISLNNPVFRDFIFYNCVLVFKMLVIHIITAYLRWKYKKVICPEDRFLILNSVYGERNRKTIAYKEIEEVRSFQIRDIERMVIFFIGTLSYLFTNPKPSVAILLMKIYINSQIIHLLLLIYKLYDSEIHHDTSFRGWQYTIILLEYGIPAFMSLMAIFYL